CDLLLTATPPTLTSTLSLHDALPIYRRGRYRHRGRQTGHPHPPRDGTVRRIYRRTHPGRKRTAAGVSFRGGMSGILAGKRVIIRSEEHTSELQLRENLVCRLLLEKKK